jgi:two-component system sensor histidine kinase/response regulator
MSDALTDPRRLAALARSGLMDSPPEEVFDRLTRLASRLLGTPIAAMSLIDAERQFFKSGVGLDGRESGLDRSFCKYVVADAAAVVISDARQDARAQHNEAAVDGSVAAYCGVPLRDDAGNVLGAFCAASSAAREWTDDDLAVLSELADSAVTELRMRTAIGALAANEAKLAQSEKRFRETFDEAPIGIALVAPDGRWLQVNHALCAIVGYTADELLSLTFQDVTHPDDLEADLELLQRTLAEDVPTHQMEKRYIHKRGHQVWIKLSVALVRDGDGTPAHFVSHIEDITHAKEIELALRENTRMLDESQSVAGLGSWGWNLETGEPWWSDQQFRLYGFDPSLEVPTSEQLLERVHPEDRGRLAGSLTSQVLHNESFVDEYRVQVPRRGLRTLLVRGDVLPADPEHDLPPRVAGTTQDVTAERAAESARQAAETRNRVLLSSLPDTLVVLYDRDLRCTLIQGAVAQLGIDPARYEGRRLAEFVSPGHYVSLAPTIIRALHGQRDSMEYIADDGRTLHVDIVPYRGEDDAILGAFTVWRDVTRALDRERRTRMLATIVEQSDDAIIAKDRDGVITEWNGGAAALYGYSAAEAIGRPIAMLAPAERDGEDGALLDRVLAGESIAQFETERRRQDGSRVPVSVSISPLYGNDDSIVGASIIARDATQRKLIEDELRSSREQALEASRLKSEFVANMSHEIRTPLNGVVSMTELLRETELSVEQREYADVALSSAEALMRVINDILDFSKIEAGKLEIVSEDYSLRVAVEEVAEIVGMKAIERGVEMRIVIAEEVADVVRGDGNRVRQILMNLLANAVKFTSQGEIAVSVTLAPDRRGAAQVRLEVADTGIGIEPGRLGILFQPFSQEDATTTRRYGGTGLGLCISKQLVELMGGEIGCESSPGRGSRFWFTLPYEPGVAAGTDAASSDLTGIRVLIVDSIADQRDQLAHHLASWGVSPDGVGDGLSALRMLRRAVDTGRPYEAALLGRTVPEKDGLELARSITSVPALRATRLMLVTVSAIDPAEARAAGIEDQILKPIRPSRLYNQLVAAVYRGRRSSTVAPPPAASDAATGQSGVRVLVVDDNEVNQFAAIRLLQTLGFNVDVANDGREAITMSGRRNYAAIFMDCQMPNVDGYTASKLIRRRERGSQRTPIIALTAHALEGDREKCLAAGMDDYIAKPLRLATIEALIQRLPALRPEPDRNAPPADPIFDPSPLREIDDPETEAALAMMFLDQATERIPALLEAIETPDHERLHSLAHGLKGSAATVGAHRISQLARALCDIAEAARESISPEAAEVHNQLAHALNHTRSALDTYIARVTER